ncbi:hypothetical protein J3R30DRAFT_3406034 [Lentinula aciculospora]|uniref:UDP-Glycosyltransferase/glycogen phosphorylase n=1 Tax=Lentinula aciculospora TaxID=153920 RepID=A0A9W9DLN1_9AGAR|nr:hypothetical protein J3R30DRAFT_3406034 [Lentinula aciculospora]
MYSKNVFPSQNETLIALEFRKIQPFWLIIPTSDLKAGALLMSDFVRNYAALVKFPRKTHHTPCTTILGSQQGSDTSIDITGPTFAGVELQNQFTHVYEAFYTQSQQGVTCMSSGKTFTPLPQPAVVIVDPYASYAYEAIRSISGVKIPNISWIKSRGHAPEALQSEEGRKAVKLSLSKKTNSADSAARVEPHIELLPSLSPSSEYKRIMVPGVWPMFTHELFPQIRLSASGKLIAIGGVYIREGDGVIMASNSAYEGEIERFGPKSPVYISFGTYAYSPQPEKLRVLVETLIANQKPFFFSHPSPSEASELQALIKESGIGMSMQWSPQEIILEHEVTGWFITHGGWNSIQETFEYEVPLHVMTVFKNSLLAA